MAFSRAVFTARLWLAMFLPALSSPIHAQEAVGIPQEISGIIAAQCLDCHDDQTQEAGLSLETTTVQLYDRELAKIWEHVYEQVTRGLMPPPEASEISSGDRALLVEWLKETLDSQTVVGGTGLRRLSRREYANSIVEVFGLREFTPPDSFPPDSVYDGFDNHSETLVLAPTHLEAFVESANLVADRLFPPPETPTVSGTYTFDAPDLIISYSSACLVEGGMRLASSGRNVNRHTTWPESFEAPVDGTYRLSLQVESSPQPDGNAPVLGISTMPVEERRDPSLETEVPVEPGELRTLSVEVDLREGESVFLRYVNGPFNYDDKKTYTLQLQAILDSSPRLAAAWYKLGEVARGGSGWTQLKRAMNDPALTVKANALMRDAPRLQKLAKRLGNKNVNTGETLVYKFFEEGPFIEIRELSIEGPIEPNTTRAYRDALAAREKYLSKFAKGFKIAHSERGTAGSPATPLNDKLNSNGSARDRAAVRMLLENYLFKLFRRPASPAEIARYLELVEGHAESGRSVSEGLHLAIRTSLISPAFLYRNIPSNTVTADVETARVEIRQLSGHELATRLAFFLTSRPPDSRLSKDAAGGILSTPPVLEQHVRRLQSDEFYRDFCEGWLKLSPVKSLMPDTRLVKKFPATLRASILQEVPRTFGYVFQNNLPIRELLAPNFVVANSTLLSEIYDLKSEVKKLDNQLGKKLSKDKWATVPVERFGAAGGLLGMPAIMMATANGVDTQPVLRGVWVLQNILGSRLPEPPNSVPALTPDTAGALSVKSRLAAHMSEESCAICHREIDPVGFVLENYDPIGRWRDRYPTYGKRNVANESNSQVIEASGTLPDGTEIEDVKAFKKWLYENPTPFVQCLSEKLLTYATGRTLSFRERKIIAREIAKLQAKDYPATDLLIALVESEVFRTQ